jgi:hypothetical protein
LRQTKRLAEYSRKRRRHNVQDSENRLANLFRRFDNIAAALESYSNISETMTEGGRVLKDQASLLLQEARQALTSRWLRLEPLEPSKREELRRGMCSDFAAVLVELSAALLPALDGTRSNGVPIELEPVLKRLAERASGGTGGRVVLYASAHLNYSIEKHNDPLTALAPLGISSSVPGGGAGEPFLFLRIPRIERDSGTLHTVIVGHELGHLRDWTHRLSDMAPPILLPPDWVDPTGSIKIDHIADWNRFKTVALAWAGEIVADIVAAMMFGPASLQALSELVGTLGLWAVDSASHPGTDRRTAIILETLIAAGFSGVPELTDLLDHFAAEAADALNRPVQIDGSAFPHADQAAWELVQDKLPIITSACGAAVQVDERFGATEWPQVIKARDCLAAGKPTGERLDQNGIPVPESDAVILNAAYLLRSGTLGELGSVLGLDANQPAEVSMTSAVLDGLVLKSFEVAEHRRITPWQ